MRRCLSAAAALLAGLLLLPGTARALDAPYAGTWKVQIQTLTQDVQLFILKVEAKASGPKIEVVAAGIPNLKDAKIAVGKAEGDDLKFTAEGPGLTLHFDVRPPQGEKEPKTMLGSADLRGSRQFVRFERTEDKEIAPKDAVKQVEGAQAYLQAAFGTRDPKEKAKALMALSDQNPNTPIAFQSDLTLLEVLPVNGAKEEDIKATADKAIKFAADYGPVMKAAATAQAAQKLVASKKAPALAVEYARQAEKGLPAEATTAQQVAVLKTLLSALKQANQKDEVATVAERVAKLDKVLDTEYLKNAVPFTTERFTREGSKGRVALVELFTGAQCPPCVAADVAFDAALKTYQPQDVVLLQYHLHIPGPDALTNDDTEKREKYYAIRGVPSTFVDGEKNLPLGGSKEMGKGAYEKLLNTIKPQLDAEAAAKIKLTAVRSGDSVVIKAEVTDLKDAGENMKLRLALCEEMVRYPGSNGQRFHHHVVRTMPGGVDGFALKEAKETQEVKVNLADLRKSLAEYLDKANERRPFADDDRPLDLGHLMVVAFVQNDKTKEVVQAAQVEVHAEK